MIRKHWFLFSVGTVLAVALLLVALGYFFILPAMTPAMPKPRPVITVVASYPGVGPHVIADTVAAPIEEQVNGVEGMVSMRSASGHGIYELNVTFQPGTNLDIAQVLVQNRVNLAMVALPLAVKATGSSIRKTSPHAILFVVVSSPDDTRDLQFLSNYSSIQLKHELLNVAGVGNIAVLGTRHQCTNIWLDPWKLVARELTVSDLVKALDKEDVLAPVARQQDNPLRLHRPIGGDPRFRHADELADTVVCSVKGNQIRVKDIARVDPNGSAYDNHAYLNGKAVVALEVRSFPGANPAEVGAGIQAKLSELRSEFPSGLAADIAFDFTPNLSASRWRSPPGYLRVDITLPDRASLERTLKIVSDCEKILSATEGIQDTLALCGSAGMSSSNEAWIIVQLTPAGAGRDKREQVIKTLRSRFWEKLPEAVVLVADVSRSGQFPSGGYPLRLAILDLENQGQFELKRIANQLVGGLHQR